MLSTSPRNLTCYLQNPPTPTLPLVILVTREPTASRPNWILLSGSRQCRPSASTSVSACSTASGCSCEPSSCVALGGSPNTAAAAAGEAVLDSGSDAAGSSLCCSMALLSHSVQGRMSRAGSEVDRSFEDSKSNRSRSELVG